MKYFEYTAAKAVQSIMPIL